MPLSKKALVGMSGGVDSAVTAWLLKKQGYDVHGVVLRLWEEDSDKDKIWTERTCCHVPMVHYLCLKILDIPFEVVDVANNFKKKVVEPFQEGYSRGETPNPCTTCNAEIKIKHLLELSRSKGISLVATGHYASWSYSRDYASMGLKTAKDLQKDQSYFLARTRDISPENLLLPLGHLTKAEVRDIALKAGFPVSGMLENQEACFVSEKRVSDFLDKHENTHPSSKQWNAKNENGDLLGTLDKGIGLTRGQRRGIGIAGGEKLYVLNVDPENKEILLGPKEKLLQNSFRIKDQMGPLFSDKNPTNASPLYVRFRSTMKPRKCRTTENTVNMFDLEEPHDGIVSGQVAAFTDRDGILVGSGIITKFSD
jgi:tRNA-specific 2-thiouridylase